MEDAEPSRLELTVSVQLHRLLGGGLDAGGVGAGGGFGETEGAEDFAGGEAVEVA